MAFAALSSREPVSLSAAEQLLWVRTGDALLLFDAPRLAEPLAVFAEMPTRVTGVTFASASAAHVVATAGDLRVFCTRTLRPLAIHAEPRRLCTVFWSAAINQFVVGGTGERVDADSFVYS